MANFYMSLSAEEVSRQVAELLNSHNQLNKQHSAHTLTKDKGAYFIDVVGGQVIGCQAIHKENDQLTRLFHLCVHPAWRRKGIARKLKLAALSNVNTPYACVTIREDNIASINLNTSLGFVFVKKDLVGDHHVLTLGRIMTDVRYRATGMGSQKSRGEGYQSTSTNSASDRLFYTRA